MPKASLILFSILSTCLLAACTPPAAPAATAITIESFSEDAPALLEATSPATLVTEAVSVPLEPITLPISLYIIDDADGPFSSRRTEEELTAVYQRVNEIWSQANIVLEVETIQRLALPQESLGGILSGNFQPFFSSLGGEIAIPEPSLLNGFYSQGIGGPNGINPFGTRVFFVMDTPSVHDERVSSHEIGHILGLHHVRDDSDRLMFSGTNGMRLTPEEITVARYFAQGILDRLR